MDYTFHRIKRLPPYVFSEVNEMKARARAAGEDVIDFGMGNPDSATPQHVVDKLVENQHRIRQAARNTKGFLVDYDGVMERAEQRVIAS